MCELANILLIELLYIYKTPQLKLFTIAVHVNISYDYFMSIRQRPLVSTQSAPLLNIYLAEPAQQ